jgi:hypothetical protein
MRVAVFGATSTPAPHIFHVLDRMHEEDPLHVICWSESAVGSHAARWASRTATAVTSIVERWDLGPDAVKMRPFYDAKAAILSVFKVYEPDRALVFGSPMWCDGTPGRLVCRYAERWGVPLFLYTPEPDGGPPVGRVVAICGARPPFGRSFCSRFKGHPTAWHWSLKRGERRSKFWLP